jgi:hypothetical protein
MRELCLHVSLLTNEKGKVGGEEKSFPITLIACICSTSGGNEYDEEAKA